jgi:hypothetical protein
VSPAVALVKEPADTPVLDREWSVQETFGSPAAAFLSITTIRAFSISSAAKTSLTIGHVQD